MNPVLALLLATAMMGCPESPTGARAPTAPPTPAEHSGAQTTPPQNGARATTPPAIQPAPPNKPVAEAVRRIAARARQRGETTIVYVGAKWCEPCRRFKAALAAGQLDNRGLEGVRFVEFDHDRDARRLAQAGYASRLLPLFSVPGPDGRGTPRRFMGARKGTGAVDNIVPRLTALIDDRPATP